MIGLLIFYILFKLKLPSTSKSTQTQHKTLYIFNQNNLKSKILSFQILFCFKDGKSYFFLLLEWLNNMYFKLFI